MHLLYKRYAFLAYGGKQPLQPLQLLHEANLKASRGYEMQQGLEQGLSIDKTSTPATPATETSTIHTYTVVH